MNARAVIFAFLVSLAAGLHAATPEAVLRGIRNVEGVKNPARRGPAGELGYYRITAAVWSQHTRKPFALCATDHGLEHAVAEKHLLWLASHMRQRGIRPTPFRLGYAWNAGLEAVCAEAHLDSRACDYAQRVQNLCIPNS